MSDNQVTTPANSQAAPAPAPSPVSSTEPATNVTPAPATDYGAVMPAPSDADNNNDITTASNLVIPTGFEDRNWVKNILSSNNPDKQKELFEQVDNLQKKLGEKVEYKVPSAESTPEEIANFYQKLGVPDKAEDYQLKPIEWAPEEKEIGAIIDKSRPEGFLDAIKVAAKNRNLTKDQLQGLLEDHDKIVAEYVKAGKLAQDEADQNVEVDFSAQADKWFGPNREPMLQNAKRIMNAAIPPEFKPNLQKFTNDQLIAVSMIASWMNNRFVREEGVNAKGSAVAPTVSRADLLARAKEKQASKAHSDQSHKDHEKTVREVKDLFKQAEGLS